MDSTTLGAIVACALVTYLTRLAGLLLRARDVPPYLSRVLDYVPLGAFTAIIVLGLTDATDELSPRIVAMVVAGAVAWRVGHLWAALGAGFSVYTLLRLVVG
jgi:branched-subunit amino acid transport protein